MPKVSAGLLMYRQTGPGLEVFLVHLGGPFFKNRRDAWGLPKGEINPDENKLTAAKREFSEETGIVLKPDTQFLDLGFIFQPNDKQVIAWAFEDGTFDPAKLKSNLTHFGWPEIDKGDYFSIPEAKKIIFKPQTAFLDRLANTIGAQGKLQRPF